MERLKLWAKRAYLRAYIAYKVRAAARRQRRLRAALDVIDELAEE